MTGSENSKFWQASFLLPKGLTYEDTEKYSAAMEDISNSVLVQMTDDEIPCRLNIIFLEKNAPTALEILPYFANFSELNLTEQDIDIKNIPDRNWLEHVYKEFPPMKIGCFFVFGEHHDGTHPTNLIPLQIGSAMAFGSGEHQTTQGCLLSLQDLKENGISFSNILDMGCGSGILAVAAAKLWPKATITAIDIEEESCIATLHHADTNDCRDIICAQTGDGYKTPLVAANAPYDLIISNILSNVLIEFAAELSANLTQDGYSVLAGLLKRQIPDVTKAHTKHGLTIINQNIQENWAIITLRART